MARILLATHGSLGDLHPYIAVGRALLARGQQVRLATAIDYRARVEHAGLEFAPLAPSIAELGEHERIARRFFDPWRGPKRLIEEMVVGPLRRACSDLGAAVEGAALAVSHPITPALPMIAESRGLPWLSFALRAGRPQLLTPAGFDQPDNAARAARLRVGRILPFRRAHSDARLARELRVLLDDPSYARAAEEAAARLRGVDGAGAAAQRIIESVP